MLIAMKHITFRKMVTFEFTKNLNVHWMISNCFRGLPGHEVKATHFVHIVTTIRHLGNFFHIQIFQRHNIKLKLQFMDAL